MHSSAPQLARQKQGDHVTATASRRRGFWLVDDLSPGSRWYRRSDGSHQYIIGNTQYSFLSGYKASGPQTEADAQAGTAPLQPVAERGARRESAPWPPRQRLAADVARNAQYFKKLRFTLHPDRYPNPSEKPFLDAQGNLTDWGDYSHRPNPRWFNQRADAAVKAAFEHDLVADLILCGPDVEEARSTLRARHNHGAPAPYLKYIARFGRILRKFLPYDTTPISNHPNSKVLWTQAFDRTQPWYDHHIIQRKIRELPVAADVIKTVWSNPEGHGPRHKPTVNDELSYQGEGDRHSEGDTIESHLGTFLGGGYGTTGWKYGNKLGHYFWGTFKPEEHTAADNLQWLRQTIDANITFWKMAPDAGIFSNIDPGYRAMAWPGNEYVLGANKARQGIVAQLPPGQWTVKRFDVIAKQAATLSEGASGRFTFDAPASRAVLFHFKRNDRNLSSPGRTP